jgi:hypothetical protein
MGIRDRWQQVDISAFVTAWFEERRIEGSSADGDLAGKATLMSFTASPSVQWAFVCAAVEQAKTDDDLGVIAAGPFESLMGKHGPDYIALLEDKCREDAKFAKMTTGAWQHLMDDDVWSRVQRIQQAAPPLVP